MLYVKSKNSKRTIRVSEPVKLSFVLRQRKDILSFVSMIGFAYGLFKDGDPVAKIIGAGFAIAGGALLISLAISDFLHTHACTKREPSVCTDLAGCIFYCEPIARRNVGKSSAAGYAFACDKESSVEKIEDARMASNCESLF